MKQRIARNVASEAAEDFNDDRLVLVVRSANIHRNIIKAETRSGGSDPEIVGVGLAGVDLAVRPGACAEGDADIAAGGLQQNQLTERKSDESPLAAKSGKRREDLMSEVWHGCLIAG